MSKLGERTITLDCDVIQADGGTRTASITGAYVALARALRKYGMGQLLTGQVAAVSVGIVEGAPFLDLDYIEDSTAGVDFNVVMPDADRLIEVQGTAEHGAFSRAADGPDGRPRRRRHPAAVRDPAHGHRRAARRVTARLLVATTNRGKQREFRRLLAGLEAEVVTPDQLGIDLEVPEPHDTYDENAAVKAIAYCRASGIVTVADDSGIEVAALDWGPGVRSARWGNGAGSQAEQLVAAVGNRPGSARADGLLAGGRGARRAGAGRRDLHRRRRGDRRVRASRGGRIRLRPDLPPAVGCHHG